jgi:hypothetical protein
MDILLAINPVAHLPQTQKNILHNVLCLCLISKETTRHIHKLRAQSQGYMFELLNRHF